MSRVETKLRRLRVRIPIRKLTGTQEGRQELDMLTGLREGRLPN